MLRLLGAHRPGAARSAGRRRGMGLGWRALRLRWFLLSHALDGNCGFVETLYRIYLNHSKIIHFRDGNPVYSLTTPALFSGPASHFIAQAL